MARVRSQPTVRPGPMLSTAITVRNLTKKFSKPGTETQFTVLDDISLSVEEGKFVSIVGPSGCGKSTLLNIIAGIEPYDSGSVRVSPRRGTPMHEPRIGYVFQSPRLLNWLTAAGNIEFALEAQNVPGRQWQERVTRQLEMVGLGGQERNYPLSSRAECSNGSPLRERSLLNRTSC